MQFRLVAIVFLCASLLGIPSAEASLKVGVVDVLAVKNGEVYLKIRNGFFPIKSSMSIIGACNENMIMF